MKKSTAANSPCYEELSCDKIKMLKLQSQKPAGPWASASDEEPKRAQASTLSYSHVVKLNAQITVLMLTHWCSSGLFVLLEWQWAKSWVVKTVFIQRCPWIAHLQTASWCFYFCGPTPGIQGPCDKLSIIKFNCDQNNFSVYLCLSLRPTWDGETHEETPVTPLGTEHTRMMDGWMEICDQRYWP